MTIDLRTYQAEDFKRAKKFFKKPNPPALLICPTAYGKTWLIVAIVNWLRKKGKRILILQPNGPLLKQSITKYNSIAAIKATAFSASVRKKDVDTQTRQISAVVFATIGTIKSVKGVCDMFDHIIIDEADLAKKRTTAGTLGDYWKTFKKFKGNILGLTATGYENVIYENPKNKFDTWTQLEAVTNVKDPFWKKILHVTQVMDLVKQKMFLARLVYEELPDIDIPYKLNGSKSNYDKIWQEKYEKKLLDQIAIKIADFRKRGYKKTIVYMQSLKQAQKLLEIVDGFELVYSSLPKKDQPKDSDKVVRVAMPIAQRMAAIEKLKNGELNGLVNVGTLTVGLDIPDLDSGIVARNTMSLRLLDQIYGRFSRVHPNKHHSIIATTKRNMAIFGRKKDIEYKKIGKRWEIFSAGEQISGKPLHLLGQVKPAKKSKVKIQFGTHKGKFLHDIPKSYWDYMFSKTDFKERSQNKKLVKKINKFYE